MRFVKYIGEDEDELINEQIYLVLDEESDIWIVEHNTGGVGMLRKHEAVELVGFTKVAPVTLMIDTSIIKAYKEKALIETKWEYLMVEAIKEGILLQSNFITEPLGEEFDKVLQNNAWELYQSSED